MYMGMDSFGMGSFSIWYWLILIVYLAIVLVPAYKIVSKAGYAGWWCLLLLVPLVNIIMVWVFAFSRWPVSVAAGRD